jgi:hypothetical protein
VTAFLFQLKKQTKEVRKMKTAIAVFAVVVALLLGARMRPDINKFEKIVPWECQGISFFQVDPMGEDLHNLHKRMKIVAAEVSPKRLVTTRVVNYWDGEAMQASRANVTNVP